jgi:hypothetical protein
MERGESAPGEICDHVCHDAAEIGAALDEDAAAGLDEQAKVEFARVEKADELRKHAFELLALADLAEASSP